MSTVILSFAKFLVPINGKALTTQVYSASRVHIFHPDLGCPQTESNHPPESSDQLDIHPSRIDGAWKRCPQGSPSSPDQLARFHTRCVARGGGGKVSPDGRAPLHRPGQAGQLASVASRGCPDLPLPSGEVPARCPLGDLAGRSHMGLGLWEPVWFLQKLPQAVDLWRPRDSGGDSDAGRVALRSAR